MLKKTLSLNPVFSIKYLSSPLWTIDVSLFAHSLVCIKKSLECQPRILFQFYGSYSQSCYACRQVENRAAYFYKSNFLSCSLALKNYSQYHKNWTLQYTQSRVPNILSEYLFLRVVRSIFTISTYLRMKHAHTSLILAGDCHLILDM